MTIYGMTFMGCVLFAYNIFVCVKLQINCHFVLYQRFCWNWRCIKWKKIRSESINFAFNNWKLFTMCDERIYECSWYVSYIRWSSKVRISIYNLPTKIYSVDVHPEVKHVIRNYFQITEPPIKRKRICSRSRSRSRSCSFNHFQFMLNSILEPITI